MITLFFAVQATNETQLCMYKWLTLKI